MLGYKAAKHDETRVLITLEIPSDAKTNVDRKYVVDKQKAKHRMNKAKVLKIEDETGKTYKTAMTGFYAENSLTYKVGEGIEEPMFNPDLDEVCTTGIHFFLDKNVAKQYRWKPPSGWTGVLSNWYENGQKHYELPIVNGKYDGVCQFWYANGQKKCEDTYVNGKMEGVRREWYSNGQKASEDTYVNGNMHGRCVGWFENGVKQYEAMLRNWLEVGYARFWHKNGQLHTEKFYEDGIVKTFREWNENGVLIGEKVSKEDA